MEAKPATCGLTRPKILPPGRNICRDGRQVCHGRMYGFLSVTISPTTLTATYDWTRSVDGSGSFTDTFTIASQP